MEDSPIKHFLELQKKVHCPQALGTSHSVGESLVNSVATCCLRSGVRLYSILKKASLERFLFISFSVVKFGTYGTSGQRPFPRRSVSVSPFSFFFFLFSLSYLLWNCKSCDARAHFLTFVEAWRTALMPVKHQTSRSFTHFCLVGYCPGRLTLHYFWKLKCTHSISGYFNTFRFLELYKFQCMYLSDI